MSTETTAELRGLLRGALAATERARVMALDAQRPKAASQIVKAGQTLLTAIASLEDDEITILRRWNRQPTQRARFRG